MKLRGGLFFFALIIALTLCWWELSDRPGGPGAAVESVQDFSGAQMDAGESADPVAHQSAMHFQQGAAQAAFRRWLADYRSHPAAVTDAEMITGAELATARRAELYRMMEQDPAEALSWTLQLGEYAALPQQVAPYVERPASGRGDIDLLWSAHLNEDGSIPCSHENRLYLQGSNYAAFGNELMGGRAPVLGTPVFAYLLDDRALLADSPVYALRPEELTAAETYLGAEINASDPLGRTGGAGGHPALVGGQVHPFGSAGSLAHVEAGIRLAETAAEQQQRWAVELPYAWLAGDAGSYQPALTQSSFFDDDAISVLFIRCDFADFSGAAVSAVDLQNDLAAVSANLNEMSYGVASLSATVTTTVYRASGAGTSYAQAGDNDGLYQDVVAAYDAAPEASVSSSYDVVAIFFPDLDGVSGSKITYGGLASVGGSRMWINGVSFSSGRISVLTHEFGHNYGLYHSNYWHPEQALGGSYYSSPAYSLEYGDIFDRMGSGSLPEAHFNHYQKHRIEWLPENNVATATGDASYRIFRFDDVNATANPLLALRVPVSGDVTWWVGHRQRYDSNPNLENGAYLVAEGLYANRPNLLDMTPGSAPDASSDRFDAALPVGLSYTDAAAGVTLRTVAAGSNGAGNEWIDVAVDFEPRLGFSQAFFEFEEAGGVAHLTLRRELDSTGTVSVDYASSDQTAVAGSDYYAAAGTVVWADGDMADKTITLHLRPDQLAESGERFSVTLSQPANAVIDVNRASADVYLLDPGERYASFTPAFFNKTVRALGFQSDGRAVIGGTIGATSGAFAGAGNIARLDRDGSVDAAFNDGGSGFDQEVQVLLVLPDDRIVLAGDFTRYNGQSVPGLVCLQPDGALDNAFVASLGAGPNAAVLSLAVEADGRILVGGEFSEFNGTAVLGLVRLNSDGSTADALNLPFSSDFRVIFRDIAVLPDGDLLVTGTFNTGWIGSGFRSGVARLNADGSQDLAFDPDAGLHADGSLNSLRNGYQLALHPDGDLLLGGSFTAYDENAAVNLVRVNASGSFDRASPLVLDNLVSSLLVEPFGGLLVGKWRGVGSCLRRIAPDWTEDANFISRGGPSGPVYTLSYAPDGSLWVAGNFFSYNGSSSRPIVRVASGVSTYERWTETYFSGSERIGGAASPEHDADGDGIPNIGEIAFGTDPTVVNASSDFGEGFLDGLSLATVGSDQFLQLTINKSALTGGVWYGVQLTSDLSNWPQESFTPGDDSVFEIIEDSRDRLVIRDRTPIRSSVSRFVRMVLSLPE